MQQPHIDAAKLISSSSFQPTPSVISLQARENLSREAGERQVRQPGRYEPFSALPIFRALEYMNIIVGGRDRVPQLHQRRMTVGLALWQLPHAGHEARE